jgi:glycosyltransferase involved in cell wall biosynthesis
MSKRIAVVTQSQYPVEVRARRMAEACATAGYEVDVYCLQKPGELAEERLNGVTIRRLPMFRKQGAPALTYIQEYTRFLFAIGSRLSREPLRSAYDVIQVYNPPDLLAFSTLIPRLFPSRAKGRPGVILDIRDVAPELYMSRFDKGEGHWMTRVLRLQERLACGYADAVTVCTTYVYDLLAGRGIDPAKMTIVMNCPDDAIFNKESCGENTREAADDGKFRLVYHGGMLERYGPDLLVRAAERLAQEIPNLHVDLYGTGDFLPVVADLAVDLENKAGRPIAKVHGFVPTEAIPGVLATADVGVVPMREDTFTDGLLPTKLMELASSGVPAVVSRTLTTASYFGDNMVQYFAPGDVDDLAAKVLELYHDPDRGKALAQNARCFGDRYNWACEKANYLALVDTVAKRTRKS